MKILFLRSRQSLHHSYQDLVNLIGKQHAIVIFDPDNSLEEQFRDIDAVIDPGGAVGTRRMIDAASKTGVKLWQVTTNGLDHVDVEYFLQKRVLLANCPGPITAVPLAEHALWMILSFAKNFFINRTQNWHRSINEELAGKTVGIIGLGASGRELARRSWPFGLRIMAIDVADVPHKTLEELHVEFFGGLQAMGRVLSAADYVSLHVPLTTKTRHLINRDALQRMKPNAVLINVARGDLVDEQALMEALEQKKIKGAGLDVFPQEPLNPDHAFLRMSNVLTTPHVAGFTTGTWERRARVAAENISRLADGLPPHHQVLSVE